VNLKSTIATSLGVDTTSIKDFTVVAEEARRRRLLSGGSDEIGPHRRLASYTWVVTFTVVASLSSVGVSSTSAFEKMIKETLGSDSFSSSLTSAVSSITGVESVSASEANSDDDSKNDDDTQLLILILSPIGGVCLCICLIGAVVYYRRKKAGQFHSENPFLRQEDEPSETSNPVGQTKEDTVDSPLTSHVQGGAHQTADGSVWEEHEEDGYKYYVNRNTGESLSEHDAWEEHEESGYKYWVHRITGQSEWDDASNHHDAWDPNAWDEHEQDGHNYYVHRVTGQSVWASDAEHYGDIEMSSVSHGEAHSDDYFSGENPLFGEKMYG
jgi:hypothetical protein